MFNNVKLEFKDGKIINATADNYIDKLNEIFDTDEGARYIGEFAIAVIHLLNSLWVIYYLMRKLMVVYILLLDERFEGEADNGNRTAIHWDLVLIQRPEYGGGAIYFDDQLVRENSSIVYFQVLNV